MEIIPDYLVKANVITWVFKSRRPFLAVVRGQYDWKLWSEICKIANSGEEERGQWVKECVWCLETEKDKEIDYL